MSLLEISNLSVHFPTAEPVKSLSFSVDAGQTVAIVGESGSGKSLTALGLIQLLPSNARATGSVRFDGRELIGLSDRQMRDVRGRDIAMIFQEPMTSLNPVVSIGNQIIEAIRVHEKIDRKRARRRAIELLDLVRIPDPDRRIDDFPHQLSGGMRQRVMIAIAVACKPRLLIADEPTTALDVTIQAQILDLLDTLRRDLGMAIVLITHDLGVVAQWADKVVVMYAGRKVEQALPDALFSHPGHPYTRGLLSASPRLHEGTSYRDSPLTEIPGSIISAAGESGCPFRPRCPVARPSCASLVPELLPLSPDRLVACAFPPSLIEGENVSARRF